MDRPRRSIAALFGTDRTVCEGDASFGARPDEAGVVGCDDERDACGNEAVERFDEARASSAVKD